MAEAEIVNEEAIDWDVIPTAEEWEVLFCLGFDQPLAILRKAFHPPDDYWISEQEVPHAKVDAFQAKLFDAWYPEEPWTRDHERENVERRMEGCSMTAWKGRTGRGRMEVWRLEESFSIVVIGIGQVGMVMGGTSSHPFIHCNDFWYTGDSDDSYADIVPESRIAVDVFCWVLGEFRHLKK